VLDPELDQVADSAPVDLFGPVPLMAGLVLVASLLLELNRLGEVVAVLEQDRIRRVRSREQREAAALAEGRVLRPPGRPKGSTKIELAAVRSGLRMTSR
jgi:hypothetical protein